ncbi:hypothetical protein HELRODRAFT_77533 [Helobdella robusta]|uniref:Ribonuclease P protein subunit p29 n=1 Tax=Helobdella robusta TaxID=6412 RepID=T1G2Z5_HELRO|nr:hypothetical protein HELRODRAFT_77533 [Helobdella robusta]ESO05603.1 hypothetical protein HELRODRAFT_77533 [Helobdella robusta]
MDDFTNSFLQKLMPKKYLKEINEDDIQQKYRKINLFNTIKTSKVICSQKRRGLPTKQKKKLKLLSLDENEKIYNLYIPLHELWLDYMNTLLDGCTSDKKEMGRRILKADLHGCEIEVCKSKCPSLVGLKGIILIETKNTMNIITRSNEVKKIPKHNCLFSIKVLGFKITIFGNNLQFKASERSTKSFKNKPAIEF